MPAPLSWSKSASQPPWLMAMGRPAASESKNLLAELFHITEFGMTVETMIVAADRTPGKSFRGISCIIQMFLFKTPSSRAKLTRPSLSGPSAPGQPSRPSILIAVDGSAISDQAVKYVVEDFGASLDVVSVVTVLPIERAEGVAMEEGSQRRRLLEEEAGQHLESACSTLRNAGIRCKTTIRFGDPATEIIKLAARRSAAT